MRGFRVERVKNFKPFNELSFSTRKALIETIPDTYAWASQALVWLISVSRPPMPFWSH